MRRGRCAGIWGGLGVRTDLELQMKKEFIISKQRYGNVFLRQKWQYGCLCMFYQFLEMAGLDEKIFWDRLYYLMKAKIYWIEIILATSLALFQFLNPEILFGTQRRYSIFLLLLTSLSLTIEKGRAQTPLILLLVLWQIASSSSQLQVGKLMFTALVLGLVFGTKRYEIKKDYQFMKKYEPKASRFVGYRSLEIQNVSTAIYYPTNEKSSKKVKWLVGGDKFIKNTLMAYQIITHRRIPLPFWFTRFILSYITTYELDVEPDTKLAKKDSYKIVFISHGITSTKHAHSSNAYWWVQRGYIVVAVQHNEEGRIMGPKTIRGDQASWNTYFEFRNESVKRRVKQLRTVITSIITHNTLNGIFGQQIKIDSFQLVGHSLGCATIVEAAAQIAKTDLFAKLTSLITLDPYLYPISPSSYVNLGKPYLNIKSDKFTNDLHTLQPQMELLNKNKRINQINKDNMIDLTIKGMDHLHQCDMIYIYGSMGEVLRMSRGNIELITELNALAIYLFEKGRYEDILPETNKLAKEQGGDKASIAVVKSVHE